MRLLYLPFSIIGSLVSRALGRSIFRTLWSRVDDEPVPAPGDGRGGMLKVVTGRALQAAVMAGAAAAVDRLFARAFHHLVGIWPKKPPKPAED